MCYFRKCWLYRQIENRHSKKTHAKGYIKKGTYEKVVKMGKQENKSFTIILHTDRYSKTETCYKCCAKKYRSYGIVFRMFILDLRK